MARKGAVALAVGAGFFLAVAAPLWHFRPKLGPAADSRSGVWHVAPESVEPLSGEREASCSLPEHAELQKHRRVSTDPGEGVGAVCKYVVHLEGWPEGEDECILEYPTATISALRPTTTGSRLAARYYRHIQGGIVVFSGPEVGRSFVALDARWCRWPAVADGLHALP